MGWSCLFKALNEEYVLNLPAKLSPRFKSPFVVHALVVIN